MHQLLRRRCVSGTRRRAYSTKASIFVAYELAPVIRKFEAEFLTPPSDATEQVKGITERWATDFVGKHKLCPFVGKYKRSIHVAETRDEYVAAAYAYLHFAHLAAPDQTDVSTKLLVFPDKALMKNVMEFMDLTVIVREKLQEVWSPDDFDLVTFHPLLNKELNPFQLGVNTFYKDFTIRSPYPTIHLLRAADIEREITKWKRRDKEGTEVNIFGKTNITRIFMNSEETLKKLGVPRLHKEFQALYITASNVPIHLPAGCPHSAGKRAGKRVAGSKKN